MAGGAQTRPTRGKATCYVATAPIVASTATGLRCCWVFVVVLWMQPAVTRGAQITKLLRTKVF